MTIIVWAPGMPLFTPEGQRIKEEVVAVTGDVLVAQKDEDILFVGSTITDEHFGRVRAALERIGVTEVRKE